MLIKGLTYRKQNRLLFIITVVAVVIISIGPVNKTFQLLFENAALEEQLELAARAPHELPVYREQAIRLKKLIHFTETDADLKQDILNNIADGTATYNTLLLNLETPKIFLESDFLIETYEVVLKGSYTDLLRTVAHLDRNLQSGKVVSVDFALEKKDRSKYLTAHIYVQTSKVTQNETSEDTD